MARRGRKRNLEKERLYWDLLASGVGTVAACRQVGTGLRWRREMGGIRSQRDTGIVAASGVRGRYLCLFERERIQTLTAQGEGVRDIAAGWVAARPRSAGSCAALGDWAATKPALPRNTPQDSRRGAAGPSSPSTSGCTTSSRTSWGWSGAQSRSAAICA